MTAWMLYALAVSALLAAAALAAERALLLLRMPVRWVWTVALAASVAIPLLPRGAEPPQPNPPAGEVSAGVELWKVPGSVMELAGNATAGFETAIRVGWLALSFGLLGWIAWSWLRLRRERTRWTPELVDGIPVLVSDDLGPAVFGLLAPAIVIPRWLLDAPSESRRLALEHERSHLAAGDAALTWTAMLGVVVLPWNPMLWWQLCRLRAAVEMDCDRRVLAGGARAMPYAELLLQLAGGAAPPWMLRPTLGQPKTAIGRRILAMIETRVRWRIARSISLGAMAVALTLLACQTDAPHAPSEETLPVAAERGEAVQIDSVVAREGTLRLPLVKVREPSQIVVECKERCEVTNPPDREPLWVLDGVTLTKRPDLGSLQVQAVEVVKGPAADRLFGERGRNGVIRITTKKE